MVDKKSEIQSMSTFRSSIIPWLWRDIFLLSSINILLGYCFFILTASLTIIFGTLFPLPHPLLHLGSPLPPSETWIPDGKMLLIQLIFSSHLRKPLKSSPQNSLLEWEKRTESYLASSFSLIPPVHRTTQPSHNCVPSSWDTPFSTTPSCNLVSCLWAQGKFYYFR